MDSEAVLPELTFARAVEIREFGPFDYLVTHEDVELYKAITGSVDERYASTIPPGFAAVFGRRSYLQEHRMPEGGVLLSQDISWQRPAEIGQPLTISARLAEAENRDGKMTLTFETVATQRDAVVVTVVLKARWPK